MQTYRSIFRSDLFRDQVILITGGGTGIGRTVALELVSLGPHAIVIAGRREPVLNKTAAELSAAAEAASHNTDVSNIMERYNNIMADYDL
jgi:citronellol/citronellal dehydrogenase